VLPTPHGTYYLVELLKQPDPYGLYGPYAFGLSAFSNVLFSFGGGPGEIGMYGTNNPSALGTDVSHGCIRISNDGITKLAQEQIALTVGASLGISTLAFRYQNVYGPGQSLTNPYTGILSIFSTRIRNGNAINIFEDGRESRDFVFIDDVVAATADGIESETVGSGVFNVGSGVATDVLTVARTLQHHLGQEVPLHVSGQFRLGDIRHNVADLARVRAALGFEPRTSIEEGLGRFVAWVRGEPMPEDRYEHSLSELRAKGLFK